MDNNKYATKKYRFVVRITNQRIICSINYATLMGDKVLVCADSQELRRFGLTAGLTNYPSAYCTGLLLSRRLLQKLGMDTMYQGVTEADGRRYDVSKHQAERHPFKCLLDVGLQRTTTGSRVFGALKGACDGGLHIPHHTRRFPGSSKAKKRKATKYNADDHRQRIYGIHVETYSYGVEENDAEEYERRFRLWSKCLDQNKTESYEELYKKVHAAIRADPARPAKGANAELKHPVQQESLVGGQMVRVFKGKGKSYRRDRKLTNAERKQNVQNKIQIHLEMLAAEDESDEDESDE